MIICNQTLINGDAISEMKKIKSGSIDLILTDPPYGTMKGADLDGWSNSTTAWDTILPHEEMLEECNRVLRFNGCLILFSQDPYTSKLMTEQHGNLPFSYRYTWLKDHFANALIAKKAPVNYTEDVCVFFKKYDTMNLHPLRKYSKLILNTLGKTLKDINGKLGHRRAEHFFYVESTQFGICTEKTYLELVDKYNLQKRLGNEFLNYGEMLKFNRKFNRKFNLLEGEKFKSNVLHFKKDYGRLHPTQKPLLLIEDLIKTYSDAGDTILDFTMGSGTTLDGCRNTGRKGIGIELSKEYFDIAVERIKTS